MSVNEQRASLGSNDVVTSTQHDRVPSPHVVRLTEEWPFDTPYYRFLAQARQGVLGAFLDAWLVDRKPTTALDVGCALGWFTRYLHGRGFDVTGLDVRDVSIEEARRRNPGLRFEVQDAEDPSIRRYGPVDFVLCVGLLYHLENPFLAIRNLAALARKCTYVEGMIVDNPKPLAELCDEGKTESQGARFVAFVPTESCMVKMFYRAGFKYVYRPPQPREKTFRRSLLHHRRRTVLLASHEPIDLPMLTYLPEPRHPKPGWDRFPLLSRAGRFARRTIFGALRIPERTLRG